MGFLVFNSFEVVSPITTHILGGIFGVGRFLRGDVELMGGWEVDQN